jgi:hypothetical protein
VFFNCVSDDSFVHVVDLLTSGVGCRINDAACTFPDDLDPGEISFVGVKFSLFEDSVVLSVVELKEFLTVLCRDHIANFPGDKEILSQFLSRPFATV